jgi:regulator of RNase E activity RraA
MHEQKDSPRRLDATAIVKLRRWNTPTVYNGWEAITARDGARDAIHLEPATDFMPALGPIVGRAVTVVVEPSNARHPRKNPTAWIDYWRYVAEQPEPKVLVMQDLDRPHSVGACMGEVNATILRALGCVGAVVDGAVRDVDEMAALGFKTLARQLCVGHAHGCPIRFGCEVEVFGRPVSPGQLIHADKHGFLAIPPEDEGGLLESSARMDALECDTLICAARATTGMSTEQILARIERAVADFETARRPAPGAADS